MSFVTPGQGSATQGQITIYPARIVHTMNPAVPTADAVAVLQNKTLGVGTLAELAQWGDHRIDDRFADKVIMPGFIEAHSHVMAGGVWRHTYVGFFDRRDPDGRVWDGCKNIAAVIARLREVEATLTDPEQVLLAWGFDPIYFEGEERLVARHLDQVSKTRPVFVHHASAHLATVNTALMEGEGIDDSVVTPGVARGPDGIPNGELQEPAAMSLAGMAYRTLGQNMTRDDSLWNYAYEARNSGHTLLCDLGTTNVLSDDAMQRWLRIASDEAFPVRVMIAGSTLSAPHATASEIIDAVRHHRSAAGDRLRFGIIKLVLDGSIQGFTARVSWPHYYKPPPGHPGNGLWLIAPDQMPSLVSEFHNAGLTVHVHCNGDEATEVFIDAVQMALEAKPRRDHRHTVQHCQLTTPAQYRRMAALGMCANIFANHIYYWGDQHRDFTVGPERAAGMDACATAERLGVSFSIHSDAPITPLGHLHTAWCAVNRVTSTGRVLGADERISVTSAMRAVTIDAAYQLKLDHEMGSIEAGKLADYAILEDDPYEVDPINLRDVGVWGTMVGGVPFASES